ncbi:hypothetical protein ACP70R_033839 [Stipagrostis hirtigluma subsp. patula]
MGSLGTQEPNSVCASSGPIDQHSQETTFDQTAGASALLNRQYDYSHHEASKHNIGISEVHFLPDESSAAMTYIHPLSSCDYGSIILKSHEASTPAQCSSDLETVFSPDLKQVDPQSNATDHSSTVDPQSNATDHSSTATNDNSEFLQLVISSTDEGYISSEFQIWDVLDLYFPESFSAVQFNSLMGFTNDDKTSYHECVDAVDMAERSISPILDKPREADCASCGLPVDYATFYLQNTPSDSDNECSSAFCNVLGCECSNNQVLYTGLPHLMDIGSPLAETKNIVLVLDLDETLVFQLQVHNGILITSWFDDPTDLELVEILAFLATLVEAEDVRPIISKTFNKPQ